MNLDTEELTKLAIKTCIVLVVALIATNIFTYRVEETEVAIMTQFGEIQNEPITESGLHFKTPFIQKIHKLTKQVQPWDGDPDQIPTKDKLFIYADTFARWQIQDFKVFFQKFRTAETAQTRIADVIDNATREVVANNTLIELIRSQNRTPAKAEIETSNPNQWQAIQTGRTNIENQILERAQPTLANMGINLLNVKIKRVNYNSQVQTAIFQRMAAERNQIAQQFISEGEGEAAKILGQRERELQSIQSEAYKKIEEIKGRADAIAAGIYNSTYTSSEVAANYYNLTKGLETLEKTIQQNDTLVISTNSQLYQLLK